MFKQIMITGLVLAASIGFMRVSAAGSDKAMLQQDENFFLQDEIKKLQVELINKDNAIKKVLLERETARYDLDGVNKEKDVLEGKIASLYKIIAARDEELLRHVELAVMPYRSQVQDAVDQLKVVTMTLEEKKLHVTALMKDNEDLHRKIEMLTGEKLMLLQSVKKIAAEHDALKVQLNDRAAEARSQEEKKLKDLQVRLAAEQRLGQEKIAQAKKPLEDKITEMESAHKAREAEALRQGNATLALLQEKVRRLEQQIKDLNENLGACLKTPAAVKK